MPFAALWAVLRGFLTRLLATLGIGFGSYVATQTLTNIFMLSLFTIVLPFVIKSLFLWFAVQGLSLIAAKFVGIEPVIINLTGLGAWLADCLQVPAAVSVYLGFCSYKLYLKLSNRIIGNGW